MTVCEFCGFDSEADSLVAEGAPCGVDGCPVLSCCYDQWLKHAKKCHKHKSWCDIKEKDKSSNEYGMGCA